MGVGMAGNEISAAYGLAHNLGVSVNKITDGEESRLDIVFIKNIKHTVGV